MHFAGLVSRLAALGQRNQALGLPTHCFGLCPSGAYPLITEQLLH
jgi:hypothetical protein